MSRLFGTILLLPLLWLPVGTNTAATQSPASHFQISFVTPDGVLVPFAEYRDGKWHAPWADKKRSADAAAGEPTIADLSRPWFAEGNGSSATFSLLSGRVGSGKQIKWFGVTSQLTAPFDYRR